MFKPSLFDDWDQLKENAKSLAEIVAEQHEAALTMNGVRAAISCSCC